MNDPFDSDRSKPNLRPDPKQTTPSLWSAIRHAKNPDDPQYQDAWTKLVDRYGPVIKAQVRQYFGQDFEDLTQKFLAGRFRFKLIPTVDESLGFKFKTCLARCLRSFLIDELRMRSSIKRGGGQLPVSLDQAQEEGRLKLEIESEEFERTLYRRIATRAFDCAFEAVRAMYSTDNRVQEFDLLTGRAGDFSDEEIGQKLGIKPGTVRVRRHRLQKQLNQAFWEEVGDLVAPEDVDKECHYLGDLL